MFNKAKIHGLLVILMISSISAQETNRRNLAVYEFEPRGVSTVEAQVISDRIRIEIGKLGVYNIIERGLMEEVINEQAFQLTGFCTEASCLVEVGRLLAVHYIVGGSVSKIGNLFTIDARIIDVESGEIVNSVIEDYNGPIENLLVQTTKIVAAKLSGKAEGQITLLLTGTCDLLVQSNPSGGTIYINDKPMGDVTPYRLEGLREGDYTIKVRKGDLVGETAISLERNDRKEVSVSLIVEQYILRIYSEPEDADVTINQTSIGKTPIDYTVTDTTIDYQIQLRKDLYFNIDETVHFSITAMLRLNYNLERCGRIEIPFQDDIDVFLNDKHLNQVSNITVVGSAFPNNRRWVIDQLGFSDYRVRIEKKNHVPFETAVTLTNVQPIKNITYGLKLMNASVVFTCNAKGSGDLGGNRRHIPFQLNSGQNTNVSAPFGKYLVSATAPGYLPIKQELALFSLNPDPIAINFQRPDKMTALKRSIMFPGMGQIYSRQQNKGIILSVITSAGVGWLINSMSRYNKELTTYNDLADQYTAANTISDMNDYRSQLNSSRDKLNNYRIQFLMATSVALVSYSWNIYDIKFRFPYE
ncbi:MAG: PEGA domain-containing protein [Candidatus Marinimicrobia bacterium]|nr:PEGA domain-containing protein [Candidatus Neomarinimicrobiota bacterium]